mmetsp:Transcript_20784/g.42603  ORF Transcript_20784/g.42603 Transcript_20784/m.42603 type:complete len:296 (+) Transcript_20784:374-1261(+)
MGLAITQFIRCSCSNRRANRSPPNRRSTKLGFHGISRCSNRLPRNRTTSSSILFNNRPQCNITSSNRNSSSSSSSSSGNGAAVAMTAATATKATMGLADARQQHRLRLSSAYGSYSWEGEPPLTCVTPSYVGTCDYLLYSAEKLVPATLLSLPELDDFVNDDPSALEMTADESLGSDPPHGWNADFQSANASTAAANNPLSYSGTWAGGVKENEHKTHHCLPNAEFGSTHLALFAEFRFLKQGIASDWTEAVESAVPSAEEKEAQGTADGKGTGAGFSAVGSSFETTETDGAEEL